MNVLIVSRGFPTQKYKMNGIFEFDQAKALAKAGCTVIFTVVDVRSIRRWRKWGIERRDVDGVHVYIINLPGGRLSKNIIHKLQIIGLKIIYKRVLREFGKPDIIHSHFTSLGYVTAKLKQKFNVPIIITEHSSSMMKPVIENKLFNTAKYGYNKANKVLAVSPALVEVIEKKFGIVAEYVPNIVDTSIFTHKQKKADKAFHFVTTGNLIYRKRIDLLVQAFNSAFSNSPNVTLTIFGDGVERLKIERLIKKFQLEEKIKLAGMSSRESIAEKLKESDCFVLPSKAETFGVAYIEALAAGTPVIATRCGGPEGFVSEKNGLIIPIDDIEALTSAMRYMYKNGREFNRKYISEDIKEQFSPKSISKLLIGVYKENM